MKMTTENFEIKSIQCTQCGAPISLYGGNNILSIVCSHCGSCLDAEDSFKVLKKFGSLERPKVPLKIGMLGTIRDIQFIVIGIVEYLQKDSYGSYPWVEFLLFSKTHGYAWLIYEDGHYVFGREVKDMPEGDTPLMNSPIFSTRIKVKGKTFKVFECASATITYVEGELTWIANVGDRIYYLDAVSPPYIYSIEQRESEREYFYGEYIEAQESYKNFGLENKPKKPVGVFSCQPFKQYPILQGMKNAGIFYAAISAVLLFFTISLYPGEQIFNQRIEANTISESAPTFTVTKPQNLLHISISSPLNNAWADFDVAILDSEGSEVYSIAEVLSYYYGYEGGESWSEGSQKTSAYFKVPEAGTYKIEVSAEGGQGEGDAALSNITFNIAIKEGCKTPIYFLISFILMAGCIIPFYVNKYKFEHERWTDYYDELEDD